MLRSSVVATIGLMCACGSEAVTDQDGEAGSGGASTSSASTTSTSTASSAEGGGGFAAGGGTAGGRTAAGGSGGTAAGGSGGELPEGCPDEKPSEPDGCAPDGLMCDYGGFCNFVVCEEGSWSFPVC